MPSEPTIAVIVERRHLEKPALREAGAALEAAGCRVVLVVPDALQLYGIPDEPPPWDAALSRGRDLAGLGLLASAAALGVVTINTPRAIELVRNKIAMQSVLGRHGVPLPQTWFAGNPGAFRAIPRERFPLVVKPFDGDGARGISLLSGPQDVDLLPEVEGRNTLYLAQEFVDGGNWDLKLYGIGNRVWAVRKQSPVVLAGPGPARWRGEGDAEPVSLDPELRDIALTCGRALGLELWGVDVVATEHGPRVIEVNDFPTYSAVPGAGAAIADHVLTAVAIAAVRRRAGRSRMLSLVREAV